MQKDKVLFDLISQELNRQRNGIELIASENFTSLEVMQAMGSSLTNKYAGSLMPGVPASVINAIVLPIIN